LSAHPTVHELGHVAESGDQDLRSGFDRLSGWKRLTRAQFVAEVPDKDRRESLLRDLDGDAANKRHAASDRHAYGSYYYRYNRYEPGEYLRYNQDACFVVSEFAGAYAETHPLDDFAETFAEYLLQPSRLKEKCPEKFRFMHVEVFVRNWLKRQAGETLSTFDEEVRRRLPAATRPADLAGPIGHRYLMPLRAQLERSLTALQTRQAEQAGADLLREGAPLSRPVPLAGSTETARAADPHLRRLRDLLDLVSRIEAAGTGFTVAADAQGELVSGPLEPAYGQLVGRLRTRLVADLLGLLDPLARRILKGERVVKPSWPELDALRQESVRSLRVTEQYLPSYARAISARSESQQLADEQLRRVPAGARRERLQGQILDRRQRLLDELERIEAAIERRVRAGQPFVRSEVPDPREALRRYRREVARLTRGVRR
jgi:hypothetical protein